MQKCERLLVVTSVAVYNESPQRRLCKKPLLGMRYMWKTLAGLCVLLDSCLRDCARNPR